MALKAAAELWPAVMSIALCAAISGRLMDARVRNGSSYCSPVATYIPLMDLCSVLGLLPVLLTHWKLVKPLLP
jgi:hypothetical protein